MSKQSNKRSAKAFRTDTSRLAPGENSLYARVAQAGVETIELYTRQQDERMNSLAFLLFTDVYKALRPLRKKAVRESVKEQFFGVIEEHRMPILLAGTKAVLWLEQAVNAGESERKSAKDTPAKICKVCGVANLAYDGCDISVGLCTDCCIHIEHGETANLETETDAVEEWSGRSNDRRSLKVHECEEVSDHGKHLHHDARTEILCPGIYVGETTETWQLRKELLTKAVAGSFEVYFEAVYGNDSDWTRRVDEEQQRRAKPQDLIETAYQQGLVIAEEFLVGTDTPETDEADELSGILLYGSPEFWAAAEKDEVGRRRLAAGEPLPSGFWAAQRERLEQVEAKQRLAEATAEASRRRIVGGR